MAIGASSIVAIRNISAGLTKGNVCAQPPAFGCVETASPFTINWFNGTRTTGSLAVTLDEILDASDDTLAFLGRTVSVSGYGPAYAGVAVSAYHRVGLAAGDFVLIKLDQSGAFFEVPAANVAIVNG